jgi:hypothetical protein
MSTFGLRLRSKWKWRRSKLAFAFGTKLTPPDARDWSAYEGKTDVPFGSTDFRQ